ncbi:radical SAM/SPASM domain-containing protein [Chitinophaga filiformis]|uniref:Radical SAM protein n=1 Tax=Chitinophaga filiformis TaxID=104663 RepID=A0ABY4HT03_CHIFI|nr:radical SAM protein [Chitinophaga filiformis]UPK66707.1 radical SAM protein [Chitinophaga filiformis]
MSPAATLHSGADSLAIIAGELASHINKKSTPRSPQVHLVPTAGDTQLFVVNGSRLHNIPPAIEARMQQLLELQDEAGIAGELISLGLDMPVLINDEPLKSPKTYALSLAIAQKCNMGCTYCYADQGDFGGPTKNMTANIARQSIDLLLKDCIPGSKVQVTFLGGEPLINRKALRDATVYAFEQGRQKDVQVNFSLTTNGTLLKEDDAAFFEAYGFAVTISLDGIGNQHDQLRPLKNGAGTYQQIIEKIRPLLATQRRMQVSARVTVTPANMELAKTLQEFIDMGFHSVGFSPLLRSSSGKGEMSKDDLEQMLQGMIACGLLFEQHVIMGKRFPFLNMVNALKEIAKGTHRPYPCGAGAGYMGVSADGELSACHRFVNEPAGHMGDLLNGINPTLQNNWLASRHVHNQEPCSRCWARYLCGGGCHHEVLERGRNACDYIRGWLHYTIQAHERIARMAPHWYK